MILVFCFEAIIIDADNARQSHALLLLEPRSSGYLKVAYFKA